MTSLLVDAGNTRLKWALLNQGVLSNVGHARQGEWAAFDRLIEQVDIDDAWVSSVAGESVQQKLRQRLMEASVPCRVVGVSKSAAGVENAYRSLTELGVDRWVAAIGSQMAFAGKSRVIVDAGTAVTVDWVNEKNVFQGGAILPGAHLMHDSLVGNTSDIHSEFSVVESSLGRSTRDCVNAGTQFGLAGAIERIIAEYAKIAGQTTISVVICGGDAVWLHKLLRCHSVLDTDLIFKGLQLLAKNKNDTANK